MCLKTLKAISVFTTATKMKTHIKSVHKHKIHTTAFASVGLQKPTEMHKICTNGQYMLKRTNG
jgi:hypothetical protein